MQLTNKTYLAKGKRGIVSTATVSGRRVVVKEPNPAASTNTIEREARMLKRVNRLGIGPELLGIVDGCLVMEYVDGEEILRWARHSTKERIKRLLRELLDQCRRLDLEGISKREMTRPYKHVLVSRGRPVQIDFDRASDDARPRNVTQLCQWLTSNRMSSLLRERGCVLPPEAVRSCAKTYKQTYSDAAYRAIVALLEES